MEIASVKLRNTYQTYYIDTNSIFVNQNALCIVDTEHGVDIGNVFRCKYHKNHDDMEIKGKILRKANAEDIALLPDIESIEKKAYNDCKKKAKAKELNMKLISVKCLFDKSKIIFYFVSENRIDFRELVRELASIFRTRIEMRQIGVRDEARLVGGYGPCGKQLCCVTQRDDFDPVSIKMAKEQNLNLNSLKISGMCGRLLCCLGYEYCTYKELNKNLPAVGSEIYAGKKTYNVLHVDTLKETIQIKYDDRIIDISKKDLVLKDKSYTVKEDLLDQIAHHEDEDNSHDIFTM